MHRLENQNLEAKCRRRPSWSAVAPAALAAASANQIVDRGSQPVMVGLQLLAEISIQ
jgi:hypothetical protein